jgi:hypothetical protein
VAGTGGAGSRGDDGPAKEAQFCVPVGIAHISGELFVYDRQSLLIRRIDNSGGIHAFLSGELCEQVAWTDMCWEKIFLARGPMRCVRSVDLESGEVTDIVPRPLDVENERKGSSGDDGPAARARFRAVSGIVALRAPVPELMVSDTLANNVRCVDSSEGGIVSLVAGNGTRGYSGDHGPAQKAQLHQPTDLALVSGGMVGESYLYIAHTGNHVIRRVRLSDCEISTVAGTGEAGFSGDSGPATEARLSSPRGIAVWGSEIIISDTGNHRVRMVDRSGTIMTIAGTGLTGYAGDARDARQTDLYFPGGIAVPEYGEQHLRLRHRKSQGGVVATSPVTGDDEREHSLAGHIAWRCCNPPRRSSAPAKTVKGRSYGGGGGRHARRRTSRRLQAVPGDSGKEAGLANDHRRPAVIDFLDTSTLVKRYLTEPGSAEVRALFRRKRPIAVARMASAGLAAAVVCQHREVRSRRPPGMRSWPG